MRVKINMISGKSPDLLRRVLLLRECLEEHFYEYFSNSLQRVNDHVSEYEEMECMMRCAAVTVSFPFFCISRMRTGIHGRPSVEFLWLECSLPNLILI